MTGLTAIRGCYVIDRLTNRHKIVMAINAITDNRSMIHGYGWHPESRGVTQVALIITQNMRYTCRLLAWCYHIVVTTNTFANDFHMIHPDHRRP